VLGRKLLNLPFDISAQLGGHLEGKFFDKLDCSAQCVSGQCVPLQCCLVLPFKKVCFSWPTDA
jgi:hypothetical protein